MATMCGCAIRSDTANDKATSQRYRASKGIYKNSEGFRGGEKEKEKEKKTGKTGDRRGEETETPSPIKEITIHTVIDHVLKNHEREMNNTMPISTCYSQNP